MKLILSQEKKARKQSKVDAFISNVEINKKQDIVVRDEPESGSDWGDMSSSEDEDVDLTSLDVEVIQNQMRIIRQQAQNVDTSRKLPISIIEIIIYS